MAIYFAFSDECGDYLQYRSTRHLQTHPYFVRSTFLIHAEDWRVLSDELCKAKESFSLPRQQEVKWSYLWSLRMHKKKKEIISENKPYFFLKDIDYHKLIDFADQTLGLLTKLGYVKIINTVTFNKSCPSINENRLYKMHLQETIQRLEMEVQSSAENLVILFVDPITKGKNRFLRNAYYDIYNSGDFIDKYRHIKDSLNFEFSHHSTGIQIADFIAGCFTGHLKSYSKSSELFNKNIKPHLRTSKTRAVLGYGVREVPQNADVRNQLRKKLT